MTKNSSGAVGIVLSALVPLWQGRVRDYDDQRRARRGRAAKEVYTAFGDVLRGRAHAMRSGYLQRDLVGLWLDGERQPMPPPRPGEVVNAIAEGVACALYGDESGELLELRQRYVWGWFDAA